MPKYTTAFFKDYASQYTGDVTYMAGLEIETKLKLKPTSRMVA
jgi:hypothetical protein